MEPCPCAQSGGRPGYDPNGMTKVVLGTYLFMFCKYLSNIEVKVKQSRYRPGVAQRVPGS